MVSFGSYAPLKYRLIAATAFKYLFLTGNYHSLVHMISALGWVLLDNPYYIRGLVDLSVKGPGACGPEVQVLPPYTLASPEKMSQSREMIFRSSGTTCMKISSSHSHEPPRHLWTNPILGFLIMWSKISPRLGLGARKFSS